jgi:hypothetical protein
MATTSVLLAIFEVKNTTAIKVNKGLKRFAKNGIKLKYYSKTMAFRGALL